MKKTNEFLLRAYESSTLYKEKMKLYHNRRIERRECQPGDLVFLCNSRLRLFLGKLKSRWFGPFTVVRVFPHGAIEIQRDGDVPFKVNRQCVNII